VLAVHTNLANQTLRLNQLHRSRDQERLDPHVEQTGDGGRRIVGVQRGQHQVAGERRLDGDLGRFEVANLADHDDVGILPQKRAQSRREVQPDIFMHLNWLMPGRLYSTGSSAVQMLSLKVFSSERAEYRVVVLPEPVGPVTSTIP